MMRSPTRPLILAGAVTLFFLSFLMSAGYHVLPQVFLHRQGGEQKAMLLSLALLLSTLAATAGVLVSRRLLLAPRAMLVVLCVVATITQTLLAVRSVPMFIAVLALLQFLVNLLVDQVDHAVVARAGTLQGFNDAAGNGARLLGTLVAPAYFTLLAGSELPKHAGVALAALAALMGAFMLLRLDPQRVASAKDVSRGADRAQAQDVILFGFAVTVYAGMYLFAANAIYLLQDLFLMPDAEVRGGALIVTVFTAAIVVHGASSFLFRGGAGNPQTAQLLAPALAMAVTATLPLVGWRPSYAMCVLAFIAVGAGYGLFLRQLRHYASAAARAGRGVVLGWFNNMANVSALAAFGIMLLLSKAVPTSAYYTSVLVTITVLQVCGAGLLASGAFARRERMAPAR